MSNVAQIRNISDTFFFSFVSLSFSKKRKDKLLPGLHSTGNFRKSLDPNNCTEKRVVQLFQALPKKEKKKRKKIGLPKSDAISNK